MKIRQIIGAIIAVPSYFALHLIWISGGILHFFTAFVAYGLAGPGFWGYVVAGVAFALPFAAEIAVFIAAWNTTGNWINGYSEWLLLWLAFAVLLFGVLGLGIWLAKGESE